MISQKITEYFSPDRSASFLETCMSPPRGSLIYAGFKMGEYPVCPGTDDRAKMRSQKYAQIASPAQAIFNAFQTESLKGAIQHPALQERLEKLMKVSKETSKKCCSVATVAIYPLTGIKRGPVMQERSGDDHRLFWSSKTTKVVAGVKLTGINVDKMSVATQKDPIGNYHSERAAIMYLYKHIFRYIPDLSGQIEDSFLLEINILTKTSSCSKCSEIFNQFINELQDHINKTLPSLYKGKRVYLAIVHKGINGYHAGSKGLVDRPAEYYPSSNLLEYVSSSSMKAPAAASLDDFATESDDEDEEEDDVAHIKLFGRSILKREATSPANLLEDSDDDLDAADSTDLKRAKIRT